MTTKAEEYVQRMKVADDHYNAAQETKPDHVAGDIFAEVNQNNGNLLLITEGGIVISIPAADVPDLARWLIEVWG